MQKSLTERALDVAKSCISDMWCSVSVTKLMDCQRRSIDHCIRLYPLVTLVLSPDLQCLCCHASHTLWTYLSWVCESYDMKDRIRLLVSLCHSESISLQDVLSQRIKTVSSVNCFGMMAFFLLLFMSWFMALFVSLPSYLLSLLSHDSCHYYLIFGVTIVALSQSQLSRYSIVLLHHCGLFHKQWFVNTSLAQLSLKWYCT